MEKSADSGAKRSKRARAKWTKFCREASAVFDVNYFAIFAVKRGLVIKNWRPQLCVTMPKASAILAVIDDKSSLKFVLFNKLEQKFLTTSITFPHY